MERKMMTFAVRTTIPHQQNVQLVVKVEEANHRVAWVLGVAVGVPQK